MITIEEYATPSCVADAHSLLTSGRNAVVVGGGVFMRLSSRKIDLAIDLSRAELDFIRETGDSLEIGAMTTFGRLERSEALQRNLDGLIPKIVRNISGIQLRNMVTVGGTVYGRFGFSEFLTGLAVLNAQVVLYRHGSMPLLEFLSKGRIQDILEKVIIPKETLQGAYQMFRVSSGSLPILCAAVSRRGNDFKIGVGARPGVVVLAHQAMAFLGDRSGSYTEDVERAAKLAATELEFGSDRKASAVYRQALCRVLVKRALAEVEA